MGGDDPIFEDKSATVVASALMNSVKILYGDYGIDLCMMGFYGEDNEVRTSLHDHAQQVSEFNMELSQHCANTFGRFLQIVRFF